MKTCPLCAEEIQDAALICRFCGARATPQGWVGVRLLALFIVGLIAAGTDDDYSLGSLAVGLLGPGSP